MTRRMLIAAGIAVLAAAASPGGANAQFYKGKTLTMIINYPPGGPTDIEGRIVALHLPAHIPGKPTVIVKNIGGAGGMIGSNYLGEVAKPDGDTFGFFTWNPVAELLGDPGLRVPYSKFKLIAGVQNPLVFYIRKDTPPGIKVASDIMKTNGIKVLSLDALNANTIQGALALDILGVKYTQVSGYRGLKAVQTAILQGEGQMANTSLPGWRASIEPTMAKQGIVMGVWQIAPPNKAGEYLRSPVVPELPTFEEFYASVKAGKKPSGQSYEAMRAITDTLTAMFRTGFMPPNTPKEAVTTLRTAFVDLWKDQAFLSDYSKAVKSKPVMVTGEDGEELLGRLEKVTPALKTFIADYAKRNASK
jgi:tripartite-type tricarboxylate transporter receptor subunit TctC